MAVHMSMNGIAPPHPTPPQPQMSVPSMCRSRRKVCAHCPTTKSGLRLLVCAHSPFTRTIASLQCFLRFGIALVVPRFASRCLALLQLQDHRPLQLGLRCSTGQVLPEGHRCLGRGGAVRDQTRLGRFSIFKPNENKIIDTSRGSSHQSLSDVLQCSSF